MPHRASTGVIDVARPVTVSHAPSLRPTRPSIAPTPVQQPRNVTAASASRPKTYKRTSSGLVPPQPDFSLFHNNQSPSSFPSSSLYVSRRAPLSIPSYQDRASTAGAVRGWQISLALSTTQGGVRCSSRTSRARAAAVVGWVPAQACRRHRTQRRGQ